MKTEERCTGLMLITRSACSKRESCKRYVDYKKHGRHDSKGGDVQVNVASLGCSIMIEVKK